MATTKRTAAVPAAKKAVPKRAPPRALPKVKQPVDTREFGSFMSDKATENNETYGMDLRPAKEPGTYYNGDSDVLVNEDGISVLYNKPSAVADPRFEEYIAMYGKLPDSPADMLRAASMSAKVPFILRMDYAAKCAPFFNKRMPIGVEGKVSTPDLNLGALRDGMKNLAPEEMELLLKLLAKAGVGESAQS